MHEVGIAHELCLAVEAAARQHGLGRVQVIQLVIGHERLVCHEALQFAFDLLKPAPLMQDTRLQIEGRPGYDLLIDQIEGEP
ncbi:MAG TPA: hydrogenase maturation nickel metallochaperone HypA [Symbiobacteriaceae bacterium]|nr:hydrogenase maturation nickel metallochaperone HypA [Symbiobacteriaceae bacterium]